MKKQKILLILLSVLLCSLFFQKKIRFFPEIALDSFEKICASPFFIEVFDLDREEAVAVFGSDTEADFV